MTTKRLAELLRELTPTEFTDSVLLMWISNCENTILTDVLLASPEDCVELTELNDAKMLVPHPWDKLYLPYMQAQVAHANGEYDHYANYITLYNTYLDEYIRHIIETVRPSGGEAKSKGYYLSAYAIAVEHGYTGSVDQWLESLIGPQGDGGRDAYTIAVENGFTGTVEQWLESMKGDAATVEIVGATALAPGAAPTVTEMPGSTAQYRLYRLGIPRGDKGDKGETTLPVARASSVDSIAYSATGDHLPTVKAGSSGSHIGKGRQIVFISEEKNLSNAPTLQINGGDIIPIRLRAPQTQNNDDRLPEATLPVPVGALMRGVPYTMTFCGKYWLVDSQITQFANSDAAALAKYANRLIRLSDSDTLGVPIINSMDGVSDKMAAMFVMRSAEEYGNPNENGNVTVPTVGRVSELIASAIGETAAAFADMDGVIGGAGA